MQFDIKEQIVRSIKFNLIIAAINFATSFALSITINESLSQVIRNFFTATFFVEAGILFIIGGLTVYGGTIFVSKVRQFFLRNGDEWTPETAKRGERRAFSYLLLATLLLLESILLSKIMD